MRPLPYDQWKWQLPQHERIFEGPTTFNFINIAALFEMEPNPQAQINSFLAEDGILTSNIRDGKESPWRDYQQVLADLGLIFSMKFVDQIELTDVGRHFAGGNLTFEGLLSVQMLRYQYPNGKPDSMKSLEYGITVRPGLMVLRTLLELDRFGISSLSRNDIANHLLPNLNDNDWETSVGEITNRVETASAVHPHATRSLSLWIRLLQQTAFFREGNMPFSLALSDAALSQKTDVFRMCESMLSTPPWQPGRSAAENSRSWSKFYGALTNIHDRLDRFVALEMPSLYGDEDFHVTEAVPSAKPPIVELRPFNDLSARITLPKGDRRDFLERALKGHERRMFQTIQHHRLVNELAKHYRMSGYDVFDTPDNVDLLAKKEAERDQLIEVKTVNSVNIGKQIRLALGQVLEYKYRYRLSKSIDASCSIVINRNLNSEEWRRDWCREHDVRLGTLIEGNLHY